MTLREKLETEIIDFLQVFDYKLLYDDCKDGKLPYPLATDIFSAALILMELRGKMDKYEYQILGSVTGCLLEHDEETCKINHFRIRACLAYVDSLVNPPKKVNCSTSMMYI